MKFFRLKFLEITGVFLVVCLGFLLRAYMYQYIPFSGEPDELYSVWNGLSLIEDGVPSSWSGLSAYEEKDIIFFGQIGGGSWENGAFRMYTIVRPWFDHFPMFSLIVGGNAKLFNMEKLKVLPTGIIRLPMLFFGLVSLVLIYLVTKKLFNRDVAFVSLLFFATSPIIVFSSRMVVLENLLVIFELILINFVYEFLKTNKRKFLYLIYLMVFLSLQLKATGIFFVLAVGVLFLFEKKKREVVNLMLVSLLSVLTILGYGFYYDGSLFFRVMKVLTTKEVGFATIAKMFSTPTVATTGFFDGWFYFGFISMWLVIFSEKLKKEKGMVIIISFFITWIAGLFLTSARTDNMGWYWLPLYPLMAISGGRLVVDFIKEKSFYGLIFCFIFLLTGFYIVKIPVSGEFLKAIVGVGILIAFVSVYFKKKFSGLIKVAFVIILATMVFANSLAVINYYTRMCENDECNIPIKSDVKIKIPGWREVSL